MKQKARYVIVLMLALSMILLARSNMAGASMSANQNASSVSVESQGMAEPDNFKPGTVKPPPGSIVITESGTYSVGGFCTITIELISPDVRAEVSLMRPLPRPLPDGVHAVRQGCLVTYYESNTRLDDFTSDLGDATICFAALPKKLMKVYYHNTYAATPSWSAVPGGTVSQGTVCGDGNQSGTYVATFEKP